MENRKVVDSPVQEGPVQSRPRDFEGETSTTTVQKVDDTVQAKPPGSYEVPPKGDGREGGERR